MAARPTCTVELKHPFEHNGATHTSLTLRFPTVGDQLDAIRPDMTAAQAEVAMLAHLAGVSLEVLREVSFEDYRTLQTVLINFPLPGNQTAAAPLNR